MDSGTSERISPDRPRVLLFGLNNETSIIVLHELLAQDICPVGLVVPDSAAPHLIDSGESFRVVEPSQQPHSILAPRRGDSIVRWSWAAGLPVWVIRDLAHDSTVLALIEAGADIGIVACFSHRIPGVVLDLFAHGVLNIHPSLLPQYRGPVPLFWQFRAGEPAIGSTVHLMDEGLDTGNIIAQAIVSLPDGISGTDATRLLAQRGAKLVAEQVAGLVGGRVLRAAPQLPGGSYFGWPTDEDFSISVGWTARRAYNFMRGTAEWRKPYRIVVDGALLHLTEAIEFSYELVASPLEYLPGGMVRLGLAEGTLLARFAEHPPSLDGRES